MCLAIVHLARAADLKIKGGDMIGAIATFKELVDWILLIPKLVKINAQQRQETRDAVGTVADELIRGLDLVAQHIEGGKRIAESKQKGSKKELQDYLSDTEWKLRKSFSEFKICRGLREKRDHFKQLFHPASASVKRKNLGTVNDLLGELEHDERMIIDEVGPMIVDLRSAARKSKKSYVDAADQSLQQIKSRKTMIRRLARKIHDKL
jgi:hypothetical protein